MTFMATLTAALKAIPEIVGLIRDISDGIGKLRDSFDDKNFEKYKKEMLRETARLRNAKTEDEVRDIIARLNPPK